MEFVNFTPRRVSLTAMVGEIAVVVTVAPAQQDQRVLPVPDGRRVYVVDPGHGSLPTDRDDVVVVGHGYFRLADQVGAEALPA